jgi:hypothetical protein
MDDWADARRSRVKVDKQNVGAFGWFHDGFQRGPAVSILMQRNSAKHIYIVWYSFALLLVTSLAHDHMYQK